LLKSALQNDGSWSELVSLDFIIKDV
jgi:hypothetical protein